MGSLYCILTEAVVVFSGYRWLLDIDGSDNVLTVETPL